jgi:hypothetical protein
MENNHARSTQAPFIYCRESVKTAIKHRYGSQKGAGTPPPGNAVHATCGRFAAIRQRP